VSRPHLPTHLLVIDDDISIRELLVEYLATRGYRVDGTSDGRIALELMRSTSYDLVLTDFQVPHRDGLDILRVARQMSPPVPTILMTGYGTVDTAVSALKEGAADFMLKPFKLRRIHEAIQQALERARQSKADSQLMSTMALYDYAESVRDRWQLRLLYEQIAGRAAQLLECSEAAVALPTAQGDWELIHPRVENGQASLLEHLDLPDLIEALHEDGGEGLVEDDPLRFYPDLPTNAASAAWLAAQPFRVDLGPASSSLGGMLVVAAREGDAWRPSVDLRQLARLATLAGNVASRVQLIDPAGTPEPTG
jgi:DNA-binding response OmpR family regulator